MSADYTFLTTATTFLQRSCTIGRNPLSTNSAVLGKRFDSCWAKTRPLDLHAASLHQRYQFQPQLQPRQLHSGRVGLGGREGTCPADCPSLHGLSMPRTSPLLFLSFSSFRARDILESRNVLSTCFQAAGKRTNETLRLPDKAVVTSFHCLEPPSPCAPSDTLGPAMPNL